MAYDLPTPGDLGEMPPRSAAKNEANMRSINAESGRNQAVAHYSIEGADRSNVLLGKFGSSASRSLTQRAVSQLVSLVLQMVRPAQVSWIATCLMTVPTTVGRFFVALRSAVRNFTHRARCCGLRAIMRHNAISCALVSREWPFQATIAGIARMLFQPISARSRRYPAGRGISVTPPPVVMGGAPPAPAFGGPVCVAIAGINATCSERVSHIRSSLDRCGQSPFRRWNAGRARLFYRARIVGTRDACRVL